MADFMDQKVGAAKPVVMLVIDTLIDVSLQDAVQNGRAPALRFLMENGRYFPDLVTAFPTMSMNVDTTLLTGTYCDKHHLPGLVWFNKSESRLVNYGTHIRELWKLGLRQALEDLLFNLNENHISRDVKTLHEEIQNTGLASASINALVFRGNITHHFNLPKLFTWFTEISKDRPVKAPNAFSYGALSKLSNRYHHIWKKLGFNNASSARQLIHLIKKRSLPSFTIAYFPDFDQRVHKHGLHDVKGIEQLDQQLQTILNAYESWEQALQETIWITIGDNGQAWIDSNRNEALIDLRKTFGSFRIMKLRKGVRSTDQIVLGVNERMAYIYTLDAAKLPVQDLVPVLQQDKRIDVIAWKQGQFIEVRLGGQKGELRFQPDGEYLDQYGQSWLMEGDPGLLDVTVNDHNLNYGVYPDALARIHSSLNSHEGDYLIVSARPGYEFIGEGSPTHIGGASHGGLHQQDSLVSMIITGTDTSPKYLRMVDLKEWVLSMIKTT